MKRALLIALLGFLMCTGTAWAGWDEGTGTGQGIVFYTLAEFPASPSADDLIGISDGDNVADCTVGGGTAQNLCAYDGSAWVIIGDGTSEGGGNSIFFEDSGASVGDNALSDIYLDGIDDIAISCTGQNCEISYTGIGGWVDTATSNLDMDNFDINNVGGITATIGTMELNGNASTVTNGVYTTDIGSTVEAYDANITKDNEVETITANWVNTANPWADNEIVSTMATDAELALQDACSEITGCVVGAITAVATADISDVSVTQTELAELETIGATTVSLNQWTLLGGLAETLTSTELNLLDGITTLSGSNTGDQTNITGNAGTVTTITGLAPDTQNTYARTQYLIPVASSTTAFGEIAIGTATHVLTSNGAGAAPTFQASDGGWVGTATSNLDMAGYEIVSSTSTVSFGGENLITTGDISINADNSKLYFGDSDDASIYFDATNDTLVINNNANDVLFASSGAEFMGTGSSTFTGALNINSTGDSQIDFGDATPDASIYYESTTDIGFWIDSTTFTGVTSAVKFGVATDTTGSGAEGSMYYDGTSFWRRDNTGWATF